MYLMYGPLLVMGGSGSKVSGSTVPVLDLLVPNPEVIPTEFRFWKPHPKNP